MRDAHTDLRLRLAVTAFQGSDGYVDTLLGMARDHIIARQLLISQRQSRSRRDLAQHQAGVATRTHLH